MKQGVTTMKETMNEATVVMAKCRRTKQPFGTRMEKKKDGVWYCTWAFRLSERAAANEGYGGTLVSGRVDLDAEYSDGKFTYSNMDDLINFCVDHMANENWPSDQVRAYLTDMLPKLNYWKHLTK